MILANGHEPENFALNWWLFLIFPMTVLSITFGSIAYVGTKDNYGLAGITIGSAILAISLIFKIMVPL